MLEKLDLTKTLSKSEYKEKIMELEPRSGNSKGNARIWGFRS